MPEAPSFRTFFGDQDRTFRLTPELITELESKTGRGIGGLCRSIFSGDFRHAEVLETVRLALIGGGESPKDAASLVDTYAAARPVVETYGLAISILEITMLGRTGKKGGRK